MSNDSALKYITLKTLDVLYVRQRIPNFYGYAGMNTLVPVWVRVSTPEYSDNLVPVKLEHSISSVELHCDLLLV